MWSAARIRDWEEMLNVREKIRGVIFLPCHPRSSHTSWQGVGVGERGDHSGTRAKSPCPKQGSVREHVHEAYIVVLRLEGCAVRAGREGLYRVLLEETPVLART